MRISADGEVRWASQWKRGKLPDLPWGGRGRGFKSRRPDQRKSPPEANLRWALFLLISQGKADWGNQKGNQLPLLCFLRYCLYCSRASACKVGKRCWYLSAVVSMDACPSRSLIIFGWTFAAIKRLACVCRKAWKLTRGTPALAQRG